jgi:RNA polymerase sigma factor (sigma-70 family)
VRQIRRQRMVMVALARQGEPETAGRAATERFDPELLHELLMTLSPACKELWRLTFLERQGYEEIARRLAIPEGTVKSRMWHCRQKAAAVLARLRRSGSGRVPKRMNEKRRGTTHSTERRPPHG